MIEHIDGFVSAKMSISALKSLMAVFDVLLISPVKFIVAIDQGVEEG